MHERVSSSSCFYNVIMLNLIRKKNDMTKVSVGDKVISHAALESLPIGSAIVDSDGWVTHSGRFCYTYYTYYNSYINHNGKNRYVNIPAV